MEYFACYNQCVNIIIQYCNALMNYVELLGCSDDPARSPDCFPASQLLSMPTSRNTESYANVVES